MVTLRLVAAAMLLALILAVVIGVFSAVRQYSPSTTPSRSSASSSSPCRSFWFAILLKDMAGSGSTRRPGSQFLYTIGEQSPYLEAAPPGREFTDVTRATWCCPRSRWR